MKNFLIIYFLIIEVVAILLYVIGNINTYLFILFTLLSTGMILLQKINKRKP